jgi:hypothetical protein
MDAFHEFRIARDAAMRSDLPSFTHNGKRYVRKHLDNITVYKRASKRRGSKRRGSKRRGSRH